MHTKNLDKYFSLVLSVTELAPIFSMPRFAIFGQSIIINSTTKVLIFWSTGTFSDFFLALQEAEFCFQDIIVAQVNDK